MFFIFLKSYVCITVSGSQVNRFINLCANRQIELRDICESNGSYSMKLWVKDFFRIKDILKKTGSRIRITQKQGFHFWLKKQAKRKIFFAGPFLCLFLLWFLSRFLWSVEVVGNRQLTEDMLDDFLKEQGVYYGMPLDEIPLQEIKLKLREEYEEINWVSVSVEGTGLEIRLKENDVWTRERENLPGTNLIAPTDGVVTDILVRQGTAVVKKGDEVKKGDTLIEGKVEIPDQDGVVKKIEYCQGDGDVWILSKEPLREKVELLYEKREYSGAEKTRHYLEVEEKKLGAGLGKIPYIYYDIVEERENLRLFGEVYLPLTICTKTFREFTLVEAKYSEQEAKEILMKRMEKIITTLEEKGVQIIEKNVKIIPNSVSMSLQGDITVLRMHNQQIQLEEKEE